MKLFVVGHARHGKDTFADLLKEQAPHLRTVSSSEFVGRRAVYPRIAKSHGYASFSECFADRVNHRALWKQLISEYNRGDPARLSRELFAEYDVYVGLRCPLELSAARHLARAVIWVDRSKHLPPEPPSSNGIGPCMADIWVDNNLGISELRNQAINVINLLKINE